MCCVSAARTEEVYEVDLPLYGKETLSLSGVNSFYVEIRRILKRPFASNGVLHPLPLACTRLHALIIQLAACIQTP